MNIGNLVHDELVVEFEEIGQKEVGSQEHSKAVDAAATLVDRAIELKKLELAEAKQAHEEKLAEENARHEKINRYAQTGLTAVSVIGGIVLTVWGAKKAWKFEETGTITSGPGRKFMDRLFHHK